jgi:hypothetical protein
MEMANTAAVVTYMDNLDRVSIALVRNSGLALGVLNVVYLGINLNVVYLGINLTHRVRRVFYVWAEPLLNLNAWFDLIKHRNAMILTTRHCAKLGLCRGYRGFYLCSVQLPKPRK